ncbi:MAG: electron transfer flavoprotein subunit beta/FixA family protein [Dehalococcoidia bacterium]
MVASLHTIVCLKVVPKPEEVTIDPATLTLDRARARSEINPPDMNAVEVALHLKDRHGGRVTILSMGPPFVGRYLGLALAMGADAAYLLSDRAFGGADTLATSYTLAEAIRRLGPFDLVLCGEESSDGATAQVPPGIAEWLNVSQVTYATELQLLRRQGQLKAHREVTGGYEVLMAPLPAVVSVKLGVNEPRFMDIERLQRLEERPRVTVWSASDLGLAEEMIGFKGSATVVAGVQEAEARGRRRERLTGTPQQKAQALLARIVHYLEMGSPTVSKRS